MGSSKTPIYDQVKAFVRQRISQGLWKPGDPVPSESALMHQFGVSRMTVNRALRELVSEGLVRRVQGSGTFVAELSRISSLLEIRDICEESPGQTVEVDGKLYKEYYGSASDFNKGEYKHVEGKRILEPVKGKLADTLREMREDVQSSISYAGGTQLTDLKKVNYVILGGENAGEHLFM